MNLFAFAVTLFFVLDPVGNAAVFHSIIHKLPPERRRRVLIRELVIALCALMFFLLTGSHILSFLGLKTHTLSISGGILLFLIALGMVYPTRSVLGDSTDEEPFIVPIAIPLMVGPSSIALMLLTAAKYPAEIPKIGLAVFLTWSASAVILLFSSSLLRLIGDKGARALERLMGLLLILVSVQMFLDGVASYLKSGS